MIESILAISTGIFVGLALGLTGSGGSLFAIPLLLFVVGLPMTEAVPLAMLVVGATALLAAVPAYRAGAIQLRPTIIFGATGVLTASVGTFLGELVHDVHRVLAFSILTLLLAAKMAWQARDAMATKVVRANVDNPTAGGVCRYSATGKMQFTVPCAVALALSGALVGVMSGFFGVGGGFLIVPTLMFVIRMDLQQAVASSLAVIALIGLSNGAFTAIPLLLTNTAAPYFALGSFVGLIVGRAIASKITGPLLQKAFAATLALAAVYMLIKSLGDLNAL